MTIEKCNHYETCSAPLCPLDKESLEDGLWFPEEEICRNREFGKLQWVKMQKKIVKKANPDFYFTFEMLNRNFMVKKNIEGIDPDKPEELQLKRWFKTHRKLEKLTESERQLKAERMEYVRAHKRAVG